jgi:hypothetical protein
VKLVGRDDFVLTAGPPSGSRPCVIESGLPKFGHLPDAGAFSVPATPSALVCGVVECQHDLTKRQLEQLEHDDRKVVVVQDPRTKQRFVVVPQDAYNRGRVLFEYLTMQSEAEVSATASDDGWSDADNERRISLINKKHDTQLTRAEERELDALQEHAYRHRERVAPVRNDVLRLLAEALDQRGPRRPETT